MVQHELHLKNWAMTIAADNDIIDELQAHEITSEYPKMAIKTNWTVKAIENTVSDVNDDRALLIMYAEGNVDGEMKEFELWFYSPRLPRAHAFDDYLNGHIVAFSPLCRMKTLDDGREVFVVWYARVKRLVGSQSNPILSIPEMSSLLLEDEFKIYGDQNIHAHDTMDDPDFAHFYLKDYLVSHHDSAILVSEQKES